MKHEEVQKAIVAGSDNELIGFLLTAITEFGRRGNTSSRMSGILEGRLMEQLKVQGDSASYTGCQIIRGAIDGA